MIWVMVCNVILEIAWIGATVFLVINGHHGWAVATILGAFLSGYTAKTRG